MIGTSGVLIFTVNTASHSYTMNKIISKMLSQKKKYMKPAHDKTYNKTCVMNKDEDQPVRPTIMARALVYPSLYSLEAVEITCD